MVRGPGLPGGPTGPQENGDKGIAPDVSMQQPEPQPSPESEGLAQPEPEAEPESEAEPKPDADGAGAGGGGGGGGDAKPGPNDEDKPRVRLGLLGQAEKWASYILRQRKRVNRQRQEALPSEPVRILHNAVNDIRVLIAYLSRRPPIDGKDAIDLPETAIALLHQVDLAGGRIEPDEAALIWQLLSELTVMAAPATPDTIRNSIFSDQIGLTERRRRMQPGEMVMWFVLSLSFVLTLCIGLYLSVTANLLQDAEKQVAEYLAVQTDKYEGTRLAAVASNLGVGTIVAANNAAVVGQKPIEDCVDSQISQPPGETDAPQFSSPNSQEDERAARFGDLKAAALEQITKELINSFQTLDWTSGNWRARPQQTYEAPTDSYRVFASESATNQIYINSVLSTFLFPLVAAVLGACVFIVRDTGQRMASVSMSTRQFSYYWPRVILAAISGIIIGWLTGRDVGGVLATLSPAFAAFLLGYSTDVMFNILDALMQSIGGKEEVNK